MGNSAAGTGDGFEKVVIHVENQVIKGFLQNRQENTLDALLRDASALPPPFLRIRPLGQDSFQEIAIEDTKAIFYVKDFDGDPRHKDLRFYRGAPIVHGVWVRVEFLDGEIMEGLVHNTIRFLADSGFFVRPTDPESNNRLVYVLKRWLRDCRILGLRNM